MSKFDDICKKVTEEVDGGLACAAVELNSGMILGVHHTDPYFTQSYLDVVGVAAVDMSRGNTAARVEELLAKQRGDEMKHMMKELQMTTNGTFHFMAIIPEKPNTLIVLITQTTVNLGMGWAGLRYALPDLAGEVPN